MATDAQIAANRRNAAHSTGPKTDAGKAEAAQNALKHGLTAKQIVIFDEREEDFAAHLDGLRAALAPADAHEDALVERIAMAQWRIRRVWRAEAAAMNQEAVALARRRARAAARDTLAAELRAHPPAGRDPLSEAEVAQAAARGAEALSDDALMEGGGDGDGEPLVADIAIWPERMAQFSRYEATLERQIARATRELERRFARRRYEALAAERPPSPEVTARRAAAIAESVARRAGEAENPWANDRSYQATMAFVKRAKRTQSDRADPPSDPPAAAKPPPR
jgi:hypothetical protein